MPTPLTTIPGTGKPVAYVAGDPVDARISWDVSYLLDRYKLKLTAGYAPTGHAQGGDHPKGLGIDLVPNYDKGGTWESVDAAAKFAAEHPDIFRWVGYDGRFGTAAAAGHGRGQHLHLSWHGGGTAGDTKPLATIRHSDINDLADQVNQAWIEASKDADPVHQVADAAAELPLKVAKAVVGLAADAIGENGVRVALWIALVGAGVVGMGFGVARVAGLGEKAKTVAGLGEKAAALAATKGAA